MLRKPPLLVFVLILCALTALGATFYFGMQNESKVVLSRQQAAPVPVPPQPKKELVPPLRVWAIATPAGADTLRQAISQWQPDFAQRLDLRVFPGRAELETARLLAAKDSGPFADVFTLSADEADARDRDQIVLRQPLSGIKTDSWLPEAIAPFIRGGDLLAYPAQWSTLVLYYNRRIFDQVGIAYPDTPWNWETLVSVSRALYRPAQSGKPTRYSLEWTPTLDLWNALSVQAGGPVYAGRSWLLGGPENAAAQREALQFLFELQQSYTFNAPPAAPGQAGSFAQGQCAMLLAGPEARTALRQNPDLQWGVAPIPDRYALEPEKCTRATPLRIVGWAVSAKSQQPAPAALLAERLSSLPLDGWLPARRMAEAGSDGDGGAVFAQALGKALPPFVHPEASRIAQSLDNLMATLRNAPTTLDKFMAKVGVALEGIDLRRPSAAQAAEPPATSAN